MMAAILNTAIVDSDTLLSPLRLTQKHSHSTLTLTQPNSIWLICWWQPSWILPCWIQPFGTKKKLHSFILTQLDDGSHLEFYHLGFSHLHKKNFIHSFWLILKMAAILNSAILDSDTAILDSDTLLSSLRITQTHSQPNLTLTQTNSIWLIWWCQPSWILRSCIQPFSKKLWLKLIQSDSNSFILTKLDDGSHLEFYHLGFSHFVQINFTHSFWLNLMMAAILNSAMLDSDIAILDSDTLLSSLRLTQNTLTLLWIWLKLIQSD